MCSFLVHVRIIVFYLVWKQSFKIWANNILFLWKCWMLVVYSKSCDIVPHKCRLLLFKKDDVMPTKNKIKLFSLLKERAHKIACEWMNEIDEFSCFNIWKCQPIENLCTLVSSFCVCMCVCAVHSLRKNKGMCQMSNEIFSLCIKS